MTKIDFNLFKKLQYHCLVLGSIHRTAELKQYSIQKSQRTLYLATNRFVKEINKIIKMVPYSIKLMLEILIRDSIGPLKSYLSKNNHVLQLNPTTSFSHGYGYKTVDIKGKILELSNSDYYSIGYFSFTLQEKTLEVDLYSLQPTKTNKELSFNLLKEPELIKKIQTALMDYYVYHINVPTT